MRGDTLNTRHGAASGDTLPVYSLYGVTLASDFRFANRLVEGVGAPDLTFYLADTPPAIGWDADAPVYASSSRLDSGEHLVYVYRRGDFHVLRFTEVADFYLWPRAIICHLLDPAYEYRVEIDLLGVAFSLWLELQGILALHASAVAVGGRAAVFLSTNGGGKSSLAASLMQAGCPLLTDDVLPVERRGEDFWGHPGYPQMRMWPDQARRFLGRYKELDIIHPAYSKRRVPVGDDGLGVFCDMALSIGCLYIPERRNPDDWGTRVEIKPLSSVEALMSLVGQSFVPYFVEPLGLQPRRLEFFASFVSQVPVRRLVYPDGFDHLPHVRRAILDDLVTLPSSESS